MKEVKRENHKHQHPCVYCSDTICKIMVLGAIVMILGMVIFGHWFISNMDQMDTVYRSHFVRCLDDGNQDALDSYYRDHVQHDDYCFETKANVSLCCMKYELDENLIETMYFESCYYGDFQTFFDKVLKPYYIWVRVLLKYHTEATNQDKQFVSFVINESPIRISITKWVWIIKLVKYHYCSMKKKTDRKFLIRLFLYLILIRKKIFNYIIHSTFWICNIVSIITKLHSSSISFTWYRIIMNLLSVLI